MKANLPPISDEPAIEDDPDAKGDPILSDRQITMTRATK
jgi:hypothetical protein